MKSTKISQLCTFKAADEIIYLLIYLFKMGIFSDLIWFIAFCHVSLLSLHSYLKLCILCFLSLASLSDNCFNRNRYKSTKQIMCFLCSTLISQKKVTAFFFFSTNGIGTVQFNGFYAWSTDNLRWPGNSLASLIIKSIQKDLDIHLEMFSDLKIKELKKANVQQYQYSLE